MWTRADRIRPGDIIAGHKVTWAIPNYLRRGETEVKLDDGTTWLTTNSKLIDVRRERARD